MKKLLILPILLFLGCAKKNTTYVPPYNAYNFSIYGTPDTVIVKSNGQVLNQTSDGYNNSPTYIITPPAKMEVYVSYKSSRVGLQGAKGPAYYIDHEDNSSPYNMCLWPAAYTAVKVGLTRCFYPKQRMIINGSDTLYKIYIDESAEY